MRDALDVFFCSNDGGWPGREKDDTDGFLRNCSVDEGARNWDWLPVDLSTGRREAAAAGLGIPDGRGMAEGCSMVIHNALRTARRLNGQQCVSSDIQTPNAYPLETRNTKPDFSVDDKLSLMGPWTTERGLSVAGRAPSNGCPVNNQSDRWRLASQMTDEGPQGRAPASLQVPRACPIALHNEVCILDVASEHTSDRLDTNPTAVAYTSRPPHAKTRIDAPPCCRRIVLDRLLLLSRVLDHHSTSWILLTAPVARTIDILAIND
jgi:hypothetical protein